LDSNATDEQIQELYGLSDQYTFEELGKVCKYTMLQKSAATAVFTKVSTDVRIE
jgi:hypothetical protein